MNHQETKNSRKLFSRKNRSVKELTVMGLMAALISVSSYIIIPLPFSSASLTAQTMIVNLTGLILGPVETAMVFAVWILTGAVGIPVFSGGQGGLGKLLGPTGGYIFGFMMAAILISMLCRNKADDRKKIIILIGVGIPVIYFCGAFVMKLVTGLPWTVILVQAVLPFIPLDIAKCFGAVFLARALRPLMR